MTVPMNDLERGYISHREELTEALLRVAQSGWYVHGPEHAAFQKEFADFVGVGHCVGVASGTDALELAIRAVGEGGAGTVLTAANAGGYTTTAARRAGRGVPTPMSTQRICASPRARSSPSWKVLRSVW